MYNIFFFSFLNCSSSQEHISINFFGLGAKYSDKPAAFFFILTFFVFCFFIFKFFFPFFKNELLNRSNSILFKFYELIKRYYIIEKVILNDIKKISDLESEIIKNMVLSKLINRRKIFHSVYKIKVFSSSLNSETKNHLKVFVNSLKNEIKLKLLDFSIEISKKKIVDLLKKDKKIFISLNNFSINRFKNINLTERQK